MSNRCYLYSIDFDASKGERKKGEKNVGLSEFPYEIPLSYKILVSQESKICHSTIWDYEKPIAIQGNFEKGKQKLDGFLNQLLKDNIFDKIELEKQISKTNKFLNKFKLENILLECGELFEMGNKSLEVLNKELFENEILKIENEIEVFMKDFKHSKNFLLELNAEIAELSKPRGFWGKLFSVDNSDQIQELQKKAADVEEEMWFMLGISYWSDILYYKAGKE